MRNIRDLLTAAALAALVGISLAATWQVAHTALPAADEVRGDQIKGFLSTVRFADLPPERQLRLLGQVERELNTGADLLHEFDGFDHQQHNRLADNLVDMAALWLEQHLDEYEARDAEQREQYIAVELDRVMNWRVARDLYRGRNLEGAVSEAQRNLAQQVLAGLAVRFAPNIGQDHERYFDLFQSVQRQWASRHAQRLTLPRPMQ